MAAMGSSLRGEALIAIIFASLHLSVAYEFDMVFQTKCIYEEISFETAVTFQYEAVTKDHHELVPLSARIESPSGHEVFSIHNEASAEHHIKEMEEGEYKICFTAKG